MENWTSPSFNFCHLWKTGLSKGRWSLLINRMFCVPYSSAHLWLSHPSSLLSSQIKTHSRLQAQIGICRSSCELSAVCHPPRNSETCTCHSCECEQLSGLCQTGPATFPGIVPSDYIPLALDAFFLHTWKSTPKLKARIWEVSSAPWFCTKSRRICGLVRMDLLQNPNESWSVVG